MGNILDDDRAMKNTNMAEKLNKQRTHFVAKLFSFGHKKFRSEHCIIKEEEFIGEYLAFIHPTLLAHLKLKSHFQSFLKHFSGNCVIS